MLFSGLVHSRLPEERYVLLMVTPAVSGMLEDCLQSSARELFRLLTD